MADCSKILFEKHHSEADWRFGNENAVFLRFQAEVAWYLKLQNLGAPESLLTSRISPTCRARIWRSEIEASLRETNHLKEGLESLAQRLETRKKERLECACSQADRRPDL